MRVVPRIGSPVPFWQGSLATPSVGDGGFFVQKIINEYRSPPRPFPDRMPPFRVRFDMHLIARDHGTYGFELDSPWDGALDVDGNRVFGSGPMAPGGGHEGEIVLTAGVHAVTLQVQPAGDPERPIRLLWKEPTKKLRPVTAADVTDPTDPRTHALRTRLAKPIAWVGALLSSFLVVAWVSRVKGDSTRDVALAASVVVAVGFLARAANFDSYPRTDLDETHNAWAGFNLLHEGHPRSWGWHPIYRSTRVSWFSYDYPIVPDAFDHTPLLPVLVGIEATVLGARTMFDCVLPRIRPLMVLVGTLSVAALFFLGRELFGFHIAFVAGISMACSPLVVFNSRLVKEDGLVQLFLLLSVFAYARGGRSARVSSHWLTGIWSGLAAFSKVMGVSIGFGLAAVALAHHRRVAPAARILMATLVLAALYPLYGMALDSETFRALTTYLSTTYPFESIADKFLILPRMILEPRISAVTPLIDGWILLGWLSSLFFLRRLVVGVPFVCYLLVLMVTVNSTYLWGFYLEPVLPLLCLAAACSVCRALRRLEVVPLFFVIALGVLPQYVTLEGAPIPLGFRGLAIAAFLPLVPSVLRLSRKHVANEAARYALAAMLVVATLANLHRCLTTL